MGNVDESLIGKRDIRVRTLCPSDLDAFRDCAIYIAIGTSGVVAPACNFVLDAQLGGAKTVELNITKTEASVVFDEAFQGPATAVVPSYVSELLDKS